MFSECRDVGQSPVVQAIAKMMNLDRTHYGKYQSIWNLNQMFTIFTDKEIVNEKEIMRKSIALNVAFSRARMTELAGVTRDGVKFDDEQMTVRMVIKKNRKPIPFDVPFKRREGDVCPVKAIEQWFNQEHCTKQVQEGVWWDFERKKKFGSIGCSKVLRSLLDDIGIDQQFGGSTVRHAMMTELRNDGATLKEVNDFTRHQEGSSCVDNFHNTQIARDLGDFLLKEPKAKRPKISNFIPPFLNNHPISL
ncbi:MAG: hypothetical protein EZS28_026874 [Streblomastix strix]|uniref:Tyr recombinase domain-containing protein n=1 Tax=Streblomastix strix TaxID=222440 RepID=A0A5J4V4E0_9EUKA|nr:MAG: hypothetical protein EZS28_026874 [Streblomastix strix]